MATLTYLRSDYIIKGTLSIAENALGRQDLVSVTVGNSTKLTIDPDLVGFAGDNMAKTWKVSGKNFQLQKEVKYYIYLKAQRTTQNASLFLSTFNYDLEGYEVDGSGNRIEDTTTVKDEDGNDIEIDNNTGDSANYYVQIGYINEPVGGKREAYLDMGRYGTDMSNSESITNTVANAIKAAIDTLKGMFLRKDQDDETAFGLKMKSLIVAEDADIKGKLKAKQAEVTELLKAGSAEIEGTATVKGNADMQKDLHVGQNVKTDGRIDVAPEEGSLPENAETEAGMAATFGPTKDGMLDGKGTLITKDGRVQTDRMQVRGTLTVLDMVASQIHSLDGYYYFSDTMKIERVEVGADSEGKAIYKCVLEKDTDGSFLKFYRNDILLSIKTDLSASANKGMSESGNRVPTDVTTTSWCEVISTSEEDGDESGELYVIVKLCDVAGNAAPQAGAYIARRGNTNTTDRNLEARRAAWCISVEEGRITYYINQDSAEVRDENYGLVVGKLPDIGPIRGVGSVGDIGIYTKVLLYERATQVTWLGDVAYTSIDEGEWNAERAANGEYIYQREYNKDWNKTYIVQSKVTHKGGTWLCLENGTTEEPSAGSTAWSLIAGGDTIIDTKVFYAITQTDTIEPDGVELGEIEPEWTTDQQKLLSPTVEDPNYYYGPYYPYMWSKTVVFTMGNPFGFDSVPEHIIGVWGETGEVIQAEVENSLFVVGIGNDAVLDVASYLHTTARIMRAETPMEIHIGECDVVSEHDEKLTVFLTRNATDTTVLDIDIEMAKGLLFDDNAAHVVTVRVAGHVGTEIFTRLVNIEIKGNHLAKDGDSAISIRMDRDNILVPVGMNDDGLSVISDGSAIRVEVVTIIGSNLNPDSKAYFNDTESFSIRYGGVHSDWLHVSTGEGINYAFVKPIAGATCDPTDFAEITFNAKWGSGTINLVVRILPNVRGMDAIGVDGDSFEGIVSYYVATATEQLSTNNLGYLFPDVIPSNYGSGNPYLWRRDDVKVRNGETGETSILQGTWQLFSHYGADGAPGVGTQGYSGCIMRPYYDNVVRGQTFLCDTNVDTSGREDKNHYQDYIIVSMASATSGYLAFRCSSEFTWRGPDRNLAEYYANDPIGLITYLTTLVGNDRRTPAFQQITSGLDAFFAFLVAKNANIKMLTGGCFVVSDDDGNVLAGMGNMRTTPDDDNPDGVPYYMWAGGNTGNDAEFRVDADGTVNAQRGVFGGFVRHSVRVITADNIAEFVRPGLIPNIYDGGEPVNGWIFDYEKAGANVIFYSYQAVTGGHADQYRGYGRISDKLEQISNNLGISHINNNRIYVPLHWAGPVGNTTWVRYAQDVLYQSEEWAYREYNIARQYLGQSLSYTNATASAIGDIDVVFCGARSGLMDDPGLSILPYGKGGVDNDRSEIILDCKTITDSVGWNHAIQWVPQHHGPAFPSSAYMNVVGILPPKPEIT